MLNARKQKAPAISPQSPYRMICHLNGINVASKKRNKINTKTSATLSRQYNNLIGRNELVSVGPMDVNTITLPRAMRNGDLEKGELAKWTRCVSGNIGSSAMAQMIVSVADMTIYKRNTSVTHDSC